MRRKILIIGCVLATISFSACQSGDTNIKDNKQVSSYKKSDSKKVCEIGLENNKDDNKEKVENKSVKVEDKNKDKITEKNTDVDLSKFDITSEDDDKYSGLMFIPTMLKDSLQLRFKEFNGVYTMYEINLKKARILHMNYSCELESGKFNIFILDSKYKVIKTLSANKEETFDFKVEDKGKYIIKAVADKGCKGKMVMDFK